MSIRIKICMWFLFKGVVLTKNNLARRNWNVSKIYCFCINNETIQHLFFTAVLQNFFRE